MLTVPIQGELRKLWSMDFDFSISTDEIHLSYSKNKNKYIKD